MADRQRFELWAETLREIGILMLVFVPLEAVFHVGHIRPALIIFFTMAGFILIVAGG